jgi:hypothetical protein
MYNNTLSWPLLIVYYLLIRIFTGVNYPLIYGFILLLLVLKTPLEKIALTFFILCIVVYVFGANTEANHYLSFVYGFTFLYLLKNLYNILKQRIHKKK